MFSFELTAIAWMAWAVSAWWFLDHSVASTTSPRKGDVGRFGLVT